jgi:hypothetical protein
MWTTPDPLGFASGSFNLYAYVENDPVNRVDRTGLSPDLAGCDFVLLGGPVGIWVCEGGVETSDESGQSLEEPPDEHESPLDDESCDADGSSRPQQDCHAGVPLGGRIGGGRLSGRADCDTGESCADGHGLVRVPGGGRFDRACAPISGVSTEEPGLVDQVQDAFWRWVGEIAGSEQRFNNQHDSPGGPRA